MQHKKVLSVQIALWGYGDAYASVCCCQATARLLNNLGDDREAVLRAARESQWEYDDEYDDSFDAMGGGAMDGVADAEGGRNPVHVHGA